MATHQARGMWVRKAIGAALAAGAMALAAPAGVAMADPSGSTSDAVNDIINDYTSQVNAAVGQFNAGSPASQLSQQQLRDQIAAANAQLRDALSAYPADSRRPA